MTNKTKRNKRPLKNSLPPNSATKQDVPQDKQPITNGYSWPIEIAPSNSIIPHANIPQIEVFQEVAQQHHKLFDSSGEEFVSQAVTELTGFPGVNDDLEYYEVCPFSVQIFFTLPAGGLSLNKTSGLIQRFLFSIAAKRLDGTSIGFRGGPLEKEELVSPESLVVEARFDGISFKNTGLHGDCRGGYSLEVRVAARGGKTNPAIATQTTKVTICRKQNTTHQERGEKRGTIAANWGEESSGVAKRQRVARPETPPEIFSKDQIERLISQRETYCRPCRKDLKSPSLFRKHLDSNHTPEEALPYCRTCKASFKSAHQLPPHCSSSRHKSLRTERTLPKQYTDKKSIESLICYFSTRCRPCNRDFSCQHAFRRHLYDEHMSEEELLYCQTCQEIFTCLLSADAHYISKRHALKVEPFEIDQSFEDGDQEDNQDNNTDDGQDDAQDLSDSEDNDPSYRSSDCESDTIECTTPVVSKAPRTRQAPRDANDRANILAWEISDVIKTSDHQLIAKEKYRTLMDLLEAFPCWTTGGDGIRSITDKRISGAALLKILYLLEVLNKQARPRAHMGDGWGWIFRLSGIMLHSIEKAQLGEADANATRWEVERPVTSMESLPQIGIATLFPPSKGCVICQEKNHESGDCSENESKPFKISWPKPGVHYSATEFVRITLNGDGIPFRNLVSRIELYGSTRRKPKNFVQSCMNGLTREYYQRKDGLWMNREKQAPANNRGTSDALANDDGAKTSPILSSSQPNLPLPCNQQINCQLPSQQKGATSPQQLDIVPSRSDPSVSHPEKTLRMTNLDFYEVDIAEKLIKAYFDNFFTVLTVTLESQERYLVEFGHSEDANMAMSFSGRKLTSKATREFNLERVVEIRCRAVRTA
ncbi:hypothetical protein B0J14DRAFT_178364 [Halenospora varia]|nr:hypothetical protein B0J14DRAFT_178364 [Halenospora varia]